MNWNIQLAKEYCFNVTDGTHDSPKAVENGKKLITSKHLKEFSLDFSSAKLISEEDYLKIIKRSNVKQWDILFSMIGTVGNTYLEKNKIIEYACKNIGIFQFNGDINKAYWFYYYLKSSKAKEYIYSHLRGSTQQYLTLGDLREFPILVPPIEIRNKIITILQSIDRKIELNEKINNNLEQQMAALYKSWFVDYLPFSGIKPESWIESDIYSISDVIYGAPFKSKLFNTERIGKPIIRIRDLKEQSFVTYTTEEHPKGYSLQYGDIVVGMDGEFRPYIWGNEEAWLNQRVCVFNNKREKGKAFLLYTLKPLLNHIEQTQVATTVIHIGKKDFDAFKFYLPDEKVLDKFDDITSPMIWQIVNNSLENKRLAVLRNSLLPKLMSGELDISDIDF